MSGTPVVLVSPPLDFLLEAVRAGGLEPVVDAAAEPTIDAIVWADARDPDGLRTVLDTHPEVSWVQLPFAGIEPFVPILDHDRRWTCGKGVYADPVAEHALGLALAGMRHLAEYGRAETWTGPVGTNLLGANVVVVGGGGITESFLRLLEPFGCTTTVVRRSPAPVPAASRTITLADLDEVLPIADLVVLAVALTPETEGLFDDRRLRLLGPTAWIVNVARGGHIDTDALVGVLSEGAIGGAALDVTTPEPLPDGHPLWTLPNCIITPHTANTPAMAVPLLGRRVRENVERFVAGRPLIGPIDIDLGY